MSAPSSFPPGLVLSLHGRSALVCGASSGIGRASALALASLGAEVTVLARREALLQALVPELFAAGAAAAHALVADMDDREALEVKVQSHIAEKGPIHVLVNNSGGPAAGALLDAEQSAFLQAFGRHVLCAHLLVRLVLPGMRAAGFGRILNVVSLSVKEPLANLGVSNTIRGAMASWSKTLALELPPGITVNNLLPGYTDTERASSLRSATAKRRGVAEQVVLDEWLAAVPEARLGRPEEIAAILAFLASPAGAYVRGASIPVDGGRLKGL
jgi:3-oxoacyl-[acyl-carrier protein] reductase